MARTVPGRECGDCTVCCEITRIRTPELVKPTGVICPHCDRDSGCTVYDARPAPCRGYECGWKVWEHLPDIWRPNQCGFLLDIEAGTKITVHIKAFREARDLEREDLASFLGAWIEGGCSIYLSTMGGPGVLQSLLEITDTLRAPVHARDLDGVYKAIRSEFAYLEKHHVWENDPEVLHSSIT